MAEKDVLDKIIGGTLPDHFGTNFTKTTHQTVSAATDPTKVNLPDGYTVLISGAGKGIGEFIAKAYVQAKATNIIITARTQKDLERVKADLEQLAGERKIRVSAVPGDATDASNWKKLADLITEEYGGRLDCLVSNAGGAGGVKFAPDARIHDTDTHGYTTITNLNYLASYYALKHLIPVLLNPQSIGKTIINVTSLASAMLDFSPIAYNIAKLALNRLTEAVAKNYKDEGLIAVSLHPGGVLTPGAQESVPWLKESRYMDVHWDVDELAAKQDEIVEGDKLKWRMVV